MHPYFVKCTTEKRGKL